MEENNPKMDAIWKSLRKSEKENPPSTYAFETRVLAGLRPSREQSPLLFWAARLAPVFILAAVLLAWNLPEEIRHFEDTAATYLVGDSPVLMESVTEINL